MKNGYGWIDLALEFPITTMCVLGLLFGLIVGTCARFS